MKMKNIFKKFRIGDKNENDMNVDNFKEEPTDESIDLKEDEKIKYRLNDLENTMSEEQFMGVQIELKNMVDDLININMGEYYRVFANEDEKSYRIAGNSYSRKGQKVYNEFTIYILSDGEIEEIEGPSALLTFESYYCQTNCKLPEYTVFITGDEYELKNTNIICDEKLFLDLKLLIDKIRSICAEKAANEEFLNAKGLINGFIINKNN